MSTSQRPEDAPAPHVRNTVSEGAHVHGPAIQAGAIHGGLHLYLREPDGPSPEAAPDSVLAPDASFVGRAGELAEIGALAERVLAPGHGSGPPAVCLVHGMGGVGKTALIRAAAARVGGGFDGGRLEVNLRGFATSGAEGGAARTPMAVLTDLLRQTGMPQDRIPAELDAAAAAWRSWLSGRRTLLLLDNAADEEQLRHLRPGPRATCLVLVSSRRQDIDADLHVAAAPLSEGEAVALLHTAGRLGPVTDARQAHVLLALARRCGLLPLALRPVGAILRGMPAEEVLEAMTPDDPLGEFPDAGAAVATAFRASYERLPEDLRRTLWHCAWLPHATFGREFVGAMGRVRTAAAGMRLARLEQRHLLLPADDGRYTFHDLFLPLARTTAAAQAPDADAERREARASLYRAVHDAVTLAFLPSRPDDPPSPFFSGPDEAQAWCHVLDSEEVMSLVPSAMSDLPERAVELAVDIAYFFQCVDLAEHAAVVLEDVLPHAEAHADVHDMAEVNGQLGQIYAWDQWMGDPELAVLHLLRAARLYTGAGDERGADRCRTTIEEILDDDAFADIAFDRRDLLLGRVSGIPAPDLVDAHDLMRAWWPDTAADP
ncbi:NB-ARC domain-containing protein [Streptomyces sp. NPDC056144]|uniref:NB-ARC domain-containing protein n=1 Tax=unclassified Streptomyces TaxID=2593676 RepID=UPI0035DAC765